MAKRSRKIWFIALALVLVLVYAVWDSYKESGIETLPGEFEEVAFVRNDQNKGGITRIYAVSVGDIEKADYNACADLFPINDFNSITKVYFFDKDSPYPTALDIEPPHYDTVKYHAINIVKRTGNN